MKTEIELISPFGDTVLLQKSGQFNIRIWGYCPDRYQRLHDIGNWLNLEWWPMCFEAGYHELTLEDVAHFPEAI